MKKLMLVLSLILMKTAYAGEAPAKGGDEDVDHHSSLHYSCRLDGDLKGVKLGFGPSAQYMGGRGEIHCVDMRHGKAREIRMPVKVTIIGAGIGADFTIVKSVRMTSGGLGYVHDPMDLTGAFTVGGNAGVTFVKWGVGITSAVSVKKHAKGLAYELGFSGEKAYGLGARLHGTVMFVKPAKAKRWNKNYSDKDDDSKDGTKGYDEEQDGKDGKDWQK